MRGFGVCGIPETAQKVIGRGEVTGFRQGTSEEIAEDSDKGVLSLTREMKIRVKHLSSCTE